MISTSNQILVNANDFAVKSVTIFQSSTAELSRTISVDLLSGRNVVEIRGISSRVDKESPRIHGLDHDARVFDISCDTKLAHAPRPRVLRPNAQALKDLTSKRKTLELERDLRRAEHNMLDNVAKSLANGTPQELDGFMDNYVRRRRAAMQAVRECEEQMAAVETEMWAQTKRGEVAGRVFATLLAQRKCKVTFQLTYLVSGVSWTPYYDLRATTSEGKPSPEVSLLYCANITQTTGEDWGDTALTLSTANSQALRNLSVPILDPLKISASPQSMRGSQAYPNVTYIPPQPVVIPRISAVPVVQSFRAVGGSSSEEFIPPAPSTSSSDSHDHNPPPPPNPGPLSLSHQGPLALSYHVEGLVSLPSDGVAHKVPIARLDFTAALKYVCVPRKNTAVFIEGTIENTSEYELLPGPVSVYMDDGFVTKTSFDLISVNESFDCVLGIDTAVRVTYSSKSDTEHEPVRSFAEPTKTTTRTVTTTATNGHPFDIANLIIRDAIPLGNEDAHITVMLRKPDGLAQAKDGDEVAVRLDGDGDVQEAKARWSKVEGGKGGEKNGMYEWVCAIAAGKKVTLEAEWAIKAPSKVTWEESVNKDGAQKK